MSYFLSSPRSQSLRETTSHGKAGLEIATETNAHPPQSQTHTLEEQHICETCGMRIVSTQDGEELERVELTFGDRINAREKSARPAQGLSARRRVLEKRGPTHLAENNLSLSPSSSSREPSDQALEDGRRIAMRTGTIAVRIPTAKPLINRAG